jgi:hypothetical protein
MSRRGERRVPARWSLCAALADQQSRLERPRQALSHLSNAAITATTAPSTRSMISVPSHMPQSCITSAWAGLDEVSIQSKAAGPMFLISHLISRPP